jgi:hypothetical protein
VNTRTTAWLRHNAGRIRSGGHDVAGREQWECGIPVLVTRATEGALSWSQAAAVKATYSVPLCGDHRWLGQ